RALRVHVRRRQGPPARAHPPRGRDGQRRDVGRGDRGAGGSAPAVAAGRNRDHRVAEDGERGSLRGAPPAGQPRPPARGLPGAAAHWVLPAAAWVERDGTYTNFEGRVQRFRQATEPIGQALAEWEIVGRLLAALGDESTATRAEHWFRQLVAAVPAFAGLSYQALGDGGRLLAGAVKAGG